MIKLDEKVLIRKEILSKLRLLSPEENSRKSEIIKQKLFSMKEFNKSRVVMFYVSMKDEVNTWDMLKEALKIGKRVAVPCTASETDEIIPAEIKDPEKELEIGKYGIYQPGKDSINKIPLDNIDLVIVPGVAFDEEKYRIGRGKGYYDRFLSRVSSRTVTIGICFDFQVVKSLPRKPHDLPVSKVITDY